VHTKILPPLYFKIKSLQRQFDRYPNGPAIDPFALRTSAHEKYQSHRFKFVCRV
jgi:hypothetical protein